MSPQSNQTEKKYNVRGRPQTVNNLLALPC